MTGAARWRIGQPVAPAPREALQSGAESPRWFVFLVRPLAEPQARAWFEARGLEAWYPAEVVWRRGGRGVRRRIRGARRVAPGYLFVRFTGAPNWAALRACRHLRRVVGVAGRPVPISDAAMGQMAKVPERLAEARRAAAEARRVRPGDRARILDGPMSGWVVEVAEIHAGVARFLLPLLGQACAQVPVDRLDREGLAR